MVERNWNTLAEPVGSDSILSSPSGLRGIFEYTNQDGLLVRTNCGQAAAATLLTYHGKLSPLAERRHDVMAALEATFGPDNLGGRLGTSRRRVVQMCKAMGLPLAEIRGETKFRDALAARKPVLVMLGVSAGKFLGYNLPGGHWMVAYAFDEEFVYLSNWGEMRWSDFRRGWDGLVPRLIQMRRRGLVAKL